jgi:anaerobic C4-dicarboxylate transporter DcuA
MSVTAAHMGITASPVSAASAALLTVLAPAGIKLADILLICIPSTIIGVLVGILFVWKRGKELNVDPEFLERMKDPVFAKNLDVGGNDTAAVLKPGATSSVAIFALAVLGVVLIGSFPSLLPVFSGEGFKPVFP